MKNEAQAKTEKVKGKSSLPEYSSWAGMKQRCYNKNAPFYKYYGGRGIIICDEWLHSFEAFYKHIGPRPTPNHSVDRIDNDGNYAPGNVRWATHSEQMLNTRHNASRLREKIKKKCLSEMPEYLSTKDVVQYVYSPVCALVWQKRNSPLDCYEQKKLQHIVSLCQRGKIDGAFKEKRVWMIPSEWAYDMHRSEWRKKSYNWRWARRQNGTANS